jgi:DNA primase
MHTIKKKLKESEDKGVFEDLINLAKELKNVDLELKRLKRG